MLQVGQVRRQVTFGRFSSVMAAAACYARMCGRAEAMARQDEEESLVGHEAAVSQAAKGVHDARARVEAAELSAGDLKLAAAEAVRKDGAVAAEAAAAAAEAAAAAAAAAAAVVPSTSAAPVTSAAPAVAEGAGDGSSCSGSGGGSGGGSGAGAGSGCGGSPAVSFGGTWSDWYAALTAGLTGAARTAMAHTARRVPSRGAGCTSSPGQSSEFRSPDGASSCSFEREFMDECGVGSPGSPDSPGSPPLSQPQPQPRAGHDVGDVEVVFGAVGRRTSWPS